MKQNFAKIDQEKRKILHLEPHDYRIYYVNIDLRHQYGISVAETQTFLHAKRPQRSVIVLEVFGTGFFVR